MFIGHARPSVEVTPQLPLDGGCRMCFHPGVRPMLHVLLPVLAVFTVATGAAFAADADPRGVPFPPGEHVLEFAWLDSGSLVVLVEHQEGYALRRFELATGEFVVLRVPRDFLNLKPGAAGRSAPDFYLSPNGRGLAVLERTREPLRPAELSVFVLHADAYAGVSTRALPADFWPEHVTWDSAGEMLYISARPYLFPDQPYSIGRLDAGTGSFQGVALKANVDLITEQRYIPRRGALAVRCWGFHGEYPAAAMIVLLEGAGTDATILHSRADELVMRVLDSGQLVVSSCRATAGPEEGEAARAGSDGEQWILEADATALRRVEFALAGVAETLATTADSSWLGFLARPEALGMAGDGTEAHLGLQRVADGRTLLTAQPCTAFAFSSSGAHVCAVGPAGDTLYFYELPR